MTECQVPIDGVMDIPVPLKHLGPVPVTLHRRQGRIGRPAQVATVNDFQPVPRESRPESGYAQRLRPHRGSTIARTHISWSTDETGSARGAPDHEPTRPWACRPS